jgi:hypothetical protein
MGDAKGISIIGSIKKYRYAIVLVVLAVALATAVAAGVYFYKLSGDRATQIAQQQSDYAALNASYGVLNGSYNALVASNNDLNVRFINLTNSYNSLSTNVTSSASAYTALENTVNSLKVPGGPAIALYYQTSNTGTSGNPNFTVNITAFNMGDETDSQFTVVCRVLFDGTLSENRQTFTNVAPLERENISWIFTPGTSLDSVWVQ